MHYYDFAGYCSMLTDARRMKAYSETMKKVIGKDSIVLDLGAGTGYFSILASKLGAKKVYALEPNSLIHLAKEFARQNNCAENIEFIQKASTDLELEEKADVLICDLHGVLPFFDHSIATIIDARKRLIKPDAVMLPRRETVYFAIAEAGGFYDESISRYLNDFDGINIASAKHLLTNRLMNGYKKEMNLLSDPQIFAALDYRTIEETSFSRTLSFEITKKGTAHGLRGWFECEIGDDLTTTNSLDNPETVYGAPFFPFENVMEVDAGDEFEIKLDAVFEKGDYLWHWAVRIFDKEKNLKADFKQSTMTGNFIAPSAMLKQSEYFVPKQNTDAEIDSFILNRMDGENMQGDIADELLEKFPAKFSDFEEALNRVSQLSQRYTD
ncbi:MAG: 50S ribosomal protein L11 methyltransferase [Pyrinomonadaceae bacterium]